MRPAPAPLSQPTPPSLDRSGGDRAPAARLAWVAGKQAFLRSGKGAEHTFEAPLDLGALASHPGLSPGHRHYNGSRSGFRMLAAAAPEMLAVEGSHLAATFSPDGRFLVTAIAGGDPAWLAPGRP